MQYTTKIGEDCVEVDCDITWTSELDDWGKEHWTAYVDAVWLKGVDIMGALDGKQIGIIEKEINDKPDSYWEDEDDFILED